MSLPPLHAERDLVLTTLAGSTAHRAQEVAVFVAQALQAQAARAAAGRDSARKRSERVRHAVRLAVGALPQGHPSLRLTVAGRIARNPQRYGLRQGETVSEDTIHDELAAMKKEPKTVP